MLERFFQLKAHGTDVRHASPEEVERAVSQG